MTRTGNASDKQLMLPLKYAEDETGTGERGEDASVGMSYLMERVLERKNLIQALRQVKRNKGGPGVDGMTVIQLPGYLKKHWPDIKIQLQEGRYKPKPILRKEVPKKSGGIRKLGVPTVLDRFIQPAIMQVLQADWDKTFSNFSFGFRPGRSAHQAVMCAQQYAKEGYSWVVDMDLEKFFDRVNHDVLMSRVRRRVDDVIVLRLVNRFLKAGVSVEGKLEPTCEGVPQGGPISPLLANLMLDELDKELESRGHRFVRYADDSNIYTKSRRAGERVLTSVSSFLDQRLKLKVNEKKSAVGRPWRRTFLGFRFSMRRTRRRCVSDQSIKTCKREIRQITRRNRGRTLNRIVSELRSYLVGWKAYFGILVYPVWLMDRSID